jgi:prepilin-type N-terminal cleavage/methylation domain-containing protein
MIRNFSRAFTLIELLVVIVVIAILATIAYPTYIGIQERAKVTKDLNNLRQIGIATQLYMNDNDGALFSTATSWMSQLHPKYLSSWNIFQSPFDTRAPSETDATAPVSYGINGIIPSIVGTSVDKIVSPSVFILFAPAQAAGTTVSFLGLGGAAVTVYKSTSTPGGTAPNPPPPHGTHSSRVRINALFADLHLENMFWTTFINDTVSTSDPSANLRWAPYTPYP